LTELPTHRFLKKLSDRSYKHDVSMQLNIIASEDKLNSQDENVALHLHDVSIWIDSVTKSKKTIVSNGTIGDV
jgi:hypothetical protein